MQLDNTISRIVVKISNKNNIKPEEVVEIMSGLYKGIKHSIHTEQAGIIKVDFFGKFIFSEAWKKKKEELFDIVDFKELEL